MFRRNRVITAVTVMGALAIAAPVAGASAATMPAAYHSYGYPGNHYGWHGYGNPGNHYGWHGYGNPGNGYGNGYGYGHGYGYGNPGGRYGYPGPSASLGGGLSAGGTVGPLYPHVGANGGATISPFGR